MLGSLCRWLRFFGVDSEYVGVEADDDEVAGRAEADGRWLLTADRELASRGPKTLLVRSVDLEDQLVEVLGRLPIDVKPDLHRSRCSRCNGRLVEQGRNDVEADVPPYVFKTAESFKRCLRCRTVVWPGTHGSRIVRRMERVAARVSRRSVPGRRGVQV